MISVFGSKVGADELREVEASIDAQWMGLGPKVAEFERRFSARLRLPGCVMVNSGSSALYLAIRLLDLPPGAEVILPSFTWVACAHAVALCGGVPVFCDVDPVTFNATAETLAARITPRTGAVMVVHYGGKPAAMEPILALGLPVIEDAAHAVDSLWRGQACGNIGDLGIYSFDAVKNLATPDSGALTARLPERLERARLLRYCGIGKSGFEASAASARWWEHHIYEVAPKSLPNDIAAGIGLAQLARLDALQARRAAIWAEYQREFAALGWLVRPADAAPDERHSYFTYCVRVPGGGRDRFAAYLYERGIYTTLRYHPLHLTGFYGPQPALPVCEMLNADALSLPVHPALSAADVAKIIEAVRAFPA
jgi:aminotransferase